MPDLPELLTITEVATILRVKPVTVRSWRLYRKHLKFSKVGGKVLVHREDLRRFIERAGGGPRSASRDADKFVPAVE